MTLMEVIYQPVVNWQKLIHNDFEDPVFEEYPLLEKHQRTALCGRGAFCIYDRKRVHPVWNF